jgi:hypothetical protein
MWTALLPAIIGLLTKVIPDPQAQQDAKLKLLAMQQAGELSEITAHINVILAEAQGNFLQRSWRPIMMLFFGGLIGARWFGYSAPNMSEAEVLELWGIVKIGIGGYTIGRSVEKIAPSLAEAFKK